MLHFSTTVFTSCFTQWFYTLTTIIHPRASSTASDLSGLVIMMPGLFSQRRTHRLKHETVEVFHICSLSPVSLNTAPCARIRGEPLLNAIAKGWDARQEVCSQKALRTQETACLFLNSVWINMSLVSLGQAQQDAGTGDSRRL